MTRIEHLLTILAEECTEIGQRASKALRFSPGEVQPGQDLTNAERIMYEFRDLQAVMEMLEDEGVLPSIWTRDVAAIEAKKMKVERFLLHSAEVGTLSGKAEPDMRDTVVQIHNFTILRQTQDREMRQIHEMCDQALGHQE